MQKLNFASLTGFVLCFITVLFGIASNGGIGTIKNFIHFPSLLVTLGGSVFAVLITADSFGDFIDGFRSFLYAFKKPHFDPEDISGQVLSMSDIARKEGLLALEESVSQQQDEFMSKGIRLVVDGSDPELVKDIMETELYHKEERDSRRVRFWQDMGASAPAWGMVGTLLGLINMMISMGTDASSIGAGMALALITTLYGSVIANWVCIPIARKLEKNSEQESIAMEVTIEGVLSIQAGENPRVIKEKLRSILETEEEKE